MIILFAVALTGLVNLPFLPGIIELIKKEDANHLFVSMDYTKESRFFARSFKDKLTKATQDGNVNPGLYDLQLSRPEVLEIMEDQEISDNTRFQNISLFKFDLITGRNVTADKEIYVRGSAHIGEKNQLRALAADQDVYLAQGTKIHRWVDAENNLYIEQMCHLGMSATAGGKITLTSGCRFKRLSGDPISTLSPVEGRSPGRGLAKPILSSSKHRDILSKEESADIIERGGVTIHARTLIRQAVRTYGDLILQDQVVIQGNLFAEGDIEIGPGSQIHGNIFSQGKVFLKEHVTVGTPGMVKSVIGKKGVVLGYGVAIYGYIGTEGTGEVL